ncbi:MAG TPA: uridine kinase [Bacteroidia bacterium]|nr:uridine kinase [Bacteroidia bacterium]
MKTPYLVGITGGSASGKTQFLKSLREKFSEEEVCFISQDDYYKPLEQQVKDENGEVNFDLPEAIEYDRFHADLLTLLAGRVIKKQSYNFNNPNEEKKWFEYRPAPIIIIEGLFIFHFKDIFNLFSLKVFVDAEEDIMLRRRMQRDVQERGIPLDMVNYQWQYHVKPAFQKYLAPYKELADIIIINNSHFNNSLAVVENHFRALLRGR